jgi:polyhydroxyalkanoate synthesis regulator phasin
MAEEEKGGPEEKGENGKMDGNEEEGGIKGGIRQGLGMLSAMKDAIEETLRDAKERGDLSPERAKEVMRSTLEKAQEKAGEAREALDFVKQKEFDVLKKVVEKLEGRISDIEHEGGGDGGTATADAPDP